MGSTTSRITATYKYLEAKIAAFLCASSSIDGGGIEACFHVGIALALYLFLHTSVSFRYIRPDPAHWSTYLLKIFLCVWTAVHLNLHEPIEHAQTIPKAWWLIVSGFAPEIVALNAFKQRQEVKKLTRDMQILYRTTYGVQDLEKVRWNHSIKSSRSAMCEALDDRRRTGFQ